MSRTLLAKNADVLVTMDRERREIRGGGLFARGNEIVAVGPTPELPAIADDVIDLTNCVVVPGLVNTHHREAAVLARSYGVSMHTHLAENDNDVAYSLEKFRMTPAEYAADLGWLGPDVWHAHAVKLDEAGIRAFARTGTGVAHCPSSNMQLASGIAPIRKMRDAGVPVGLGVDGSASNDGSHMLAEARQAMLLQRVGFGPAAMTAREALEIATLGGARVLGRDDIGALAPGMAADFAAFDVSGVTYAGALHDPVAALVFCASANVAHSVVNGRFVVRDGRLTMLELPSVVARHNRLAAALVRGEGRT